MFDNCRAYVHNYSMLTRLKELFRFLLGRHSARNATIITTILTMAGKVMGYGRTLLVAYLFGATAFVDAYYVANGAIAFLAGTVQNTVEAAILPKLIQSDEDTARNLFGYVVRVLIIGILLIAVLMLLFPESFIRIFARTFDAQRISYASDMLKWILPYGISVIALGVMTVWANYKERFALGNTVTVFSNIFSITALLLLFPILKNYALPAFQSVSFTILALLMFCILRDIPLTPHGDIPCEFRRRVGRDTLYCVVASGAGLIYTLVDRYFASSLPVGNVSAISYAQLIFYQPMGFMGSAMSVYLVRASDAVKEDATNGDRQLFTALFMAWSYFFPAAILLSALSGPIVKILLGYGAFDARAVALTTPCLTVMGLGIPIIVWNMIISKYAQALGRLRLLTIWSYVGIIGNVILDWMLVKKYGAPGLCVATVIMWGVSTVFFMLMLAPKIVLNLFRSLLLQTLIVICWGLPLWLLSTHWLYLSAIAGGIIGLLHMILCEKLGLFDKIPEEWRPLSIVMIILTKINVCQ